MSGFYALAHADKIELLTDGAVYEPDGTLTAIRRKVWTSERHPIAITGRGSGAVEAFATVLNFHAAMVDTVDAAIPDWQRLLDRQRARREWPPFEIVIAAISETRGPVILYAASTDAYGVGVDLWKLVDAGNELGGGPSVDTTGLDTSDGLRSCGAELFERMRRTAGPNPVAPELPAVYGIGGHVDLTVVRPEGVTVERIHEWPDVVGRKIDPFRDLAEAA